MKNKFHCCRWVAGCCAILIGLFPVRSAFAATQTLAPAGTALNSPHNYTWNRMSTINVDSGEVVPFVTYQFNTVGQPAGTNIITLNTVGFPGAINVYGVYFDPTVPNANFYDNGVVATTAGTVSLAVRLPTEQYFEVVFSAAYATNAGTFSATLTSPGTPTITTVTNTSIRVGPKSQTVLSGHTTKLEVFALGPLPHTWQWFSGTNLDSTKPILGATNESFTTPPLTQDTSYWVRVTGPAGAGTVKSGTAVINIANNPDAFYTGTLVTNGCRLPNGDLYGVQRFEIQQQGNYVFTISNGFSATTYQGVFDAQNPSNSFYGVLNGHYAAGSYDLVVRSTNAGSFGGTITGGPAVVKLLVPLAPQFISNPQDVTITNNQSVTLGVSTTCGTLFSLQWFKGESGDTSLPVAGATGFNYTTPLLTTTTKYWVRMIYPGGTNYSAHATVFLEVLPAYQDGELTACDRRFERPSSLGDLSGTNCFYKTFVYRVSQSGAYTFTVNSTGFVAKVHLYESSFLPNNPVVSLSYLGSTGTFVSTQIFSVNPKYLVVSGLNSNDVGTFSVTVSNGPAAITLTRAPVITSQPASTNLLRNQAATLSVGSTTPGLSYQWYGGTDCGAKTPIAGANSATFTTPPLTVYTNYWVELSGAGGYVFSTNAAVRIQPQGVTDNYVVNEDETLDATNSVLLNDLKADNRTLGVGLDVNPAHGTLMFFQTGVFVYRPETNYQGPDSFIYRIGDGTLITTNITVNIKVIEVNDPPVRTSGSFSNVFAVEDGTNVSMQLANANYNPGGGADEAGQRLFFRPTSLPNALGRVLLANQSTVVNTNSDYDLTQLRGMIFDPATNAFGTGTFDFTVKDNGRTDGGNDPRSITQSVSIVVSEVNDPPVRTNGVLNNLTVLQDASATSLGFTNLGFSPGSNETSQLLTYRIVNAPPASFGQILADRGATVVVSNNYYLLSKIQGLTFKPVSNVFGGPYTFAFSVTDDGTTAGVANFLSITQSITISVSQVNYPPVRTNGVLNNLTVLEDSGGTSLGLTNLGYHPGGGTNEAGQTLTYRVISIPPPALGDVRDGPSAVVSNQTCTLAILRTLSFKPRPEVSGGGTFAFTVTDNGLPSPLSLTQALTITVSPVADTPTITDARTTEGIQTTSGLVIERSEADGAEVGFCKITFITNGTLFQANGTTIIADGSFVTFAEGNAGLKFKPTPGLFNPASTFGFKVQASVTNADAGLGGGVVNATISVEPRYDFGDAPSAAQSGFAASYPTLIEQDGARHLVPSTGAVLFLGYRSPTSETNGVPSTNAMGDLTVTSDEDGVILPAQFFNGQSAPITVYASAAGKLDAWMDWNRDGDWSDAGEQIFTNLTVVAGENILAIQVPAFTNGGISFARFRLSSSGSLSPTGPATDGEVEDYAVNLGVFIAPQIICPSNIVVTVPAGELGASVPWSVVATGAPAVTVSCQINATNITSPHLFPPGVTVVHCYADNHYSDAVHCSFTVTVNVTPTAQDDFVTTDRDTPLTLSLVRLSDNDLDPAGQFLRVTNVALVSAQGGSVMVSATHATYTPPPSFVGNDAFTYTVVDEWGASATGTVRIAVEPRDVARLTLEKLTDGFRVKVLGTAGRRYFIESAPTPAGPWTNLAQSVAATNGVAQFDDTNAPLGSMRLYRARIGSGPPRGLLNWYRAEGNFLDSAGPKHGTPSEAFPFSGQAFHFDDARRVITLNAAPVPPPWTAGFWVSRQNSDDLSAVLLAGDDLALKLEQWPGSRQVGFSAVGLGDAYFNYVAPENAWVHLVFVATPTQTQLFVNGVLQDTLPGSIPLPRRQIGSAREGLRGLLDEVQLFDRALAPDEVQALFLNFSAPTP